MPNWVTNRIKFEGTGAEEALKSHLIKDENGEINFDFNTIEKMPEELNIEKSSRMRDGFKLGITKRCPHCTYYGSPEEKMGAFAFADWMVKTFGMKVAGGKKDFLVDEEELAKLKQHYDTQEKWDDMVKIGEKAIRNCEKYGAPDWYEWSCEHWGVKWNASNTLLCDDGVTVYFDTPWGTPSPMMERLAKLHPNLKISHDYAEEQIAFFCGHDEYENGSLTLENTYESYSKEAYEMYFDLWGCGEEFVFDPAKGTYVEKEEAEM